MCIILFSLITILGKKNNYYHSYLTDRERPGSTDWPGSLRSKDLNPSSLLVEMFHHRSYLASMKMLSQAT